MYLTDESEFYLGFPERMRVAVINDYGTWTQKKIQGMPQYANIKLFDACTQAVRIIENKSNCRLSVTLNRC